MEAPGPRGLQAPPNGLFPPTSLQGLRCLKSQTRKRAYEGKDVFKLLKTVADHTNVLSHVLWLLRNPGKINTDAILKAANLITQSLDYTLHGMDEEMRSILAELMELGRTYLEDYTGPFTKPDGLLCSAVEEDAKLVEAEGEEGPIAAVPSPSATPDFAPANLPMGSPVAAPPTIREEPAADDAGDAAAATAGSGQGPPLPMGTAAAPLATVIANDPGMQTVYMEDVGLGPDFMSFVQTFLD